MRGRWVLLGKTRRRQKRRKQTLGGSVITTLGSSETAEPYDTSSPPGAELEGELTEGQERLPWGTPQGEAFQLIHK